MTPLTAPTLIPRHVPDLTHARALTVRQPWAWGIVRGGKTVENRTWRTTYRGPVLIHAAQAVDRHAQHRGLDLRLHHLDDDVDGPDDVLPTSAVVGYAVLTDVHHGGLEQGGPCTSWAEPGVWHWVLRCARPLTTPVPTSGRLGLWKPPTDLIAAVLNEATRG